MTQGKDEATAARPKSEPREDLVFECDLDAAPAKVWRALTIPDYLAAWLAPAMPRPRGGTGLTFDGKSGGLAGEVDCRLLAADPPHRLSYAWREDNGMDLFDSVVTFELEPSEGGGTRLRITHGDFVLRPAAANLNEPTPMLLAA